MRSSTVFLVLVGLTALYLWQKHTTADAPATTSSAAVAKATPPPSANNPPPAPPTQPSEHNWMKRSLDRATAVRDQARAQTAAAQNP